MVVMKLAYYRLVDTAAVGGEREMFTFTAHPKLVEQFQHHLNDTFTTDRYDVREIGPDDCVHEWRGVGIATVDGGASDVIVEECVRCDLYNAKRVEEVDFYTDEEADDG